jgi:hypothetical protein
MHPPMIEILLAAGVSLVLLAAAAGDGGVHLLFVVGAGAIALGLAAGVPAGIAYHIALYRALATLGTVLRRWWCHPAPLHDHIPPAARPSVLAWFRAGAAGFLLATAGCAAVLAQ